MSNIVEISQHRKLDVDALVELLHRLYTVNLISRTAFNLGAQVISRFQANGEFRCSINRRDSYRTFVELDGRPFAAGAEADTAQFAHALQSLQAYCGFYSNLTAARAKAQKDRFTHFTEDHRIPAGTTLQRMIDSSVEIFFEFRPAELDDIKKTVSADITTQLMVAKWATITTTSKAT